MKRSYIIALLLSTTFVACKKYLDVSPVSSITVSNFFKTENDVEGALNGAYVRLRSLADLDLFIWGEARSEMMTNSVTGTLGYEKYYNNTLTKSNAGPDWGGIYATINSANLVIKYTPSISFSSDDKKNDALAQAYTMRAFLYFLLARTWGGVPLRLEPTESYDPATIQMARSSEADVFKQIKDDLAQAIKLFPDNSFPAGRDKWSKPAANALKGDVYLWTAKRLNGGNSDLTEALSALQQVQTADVMLLPNYADIFKYSNKGNKEIIMAIHFDLNESSNQTFAYNMYASTTSFPSYVPQSQRDSVGVPMPGGNGNVWSVSSVVRSQFTEDDKRKAATYIEMKGASPGQYYTNYGLKSSGTVSNGLRYLASDYILYRYADVLLMIAEAKNALGQDPSTQINLVRQRAYGANFSSHVFVSGTKEANDSAILQERLFEFALEGKRWWDLVRFGKAFELVPSLVGKESNPGLLYWPVGLSLTTREPLVTETEGW